MLDLKFFETYHLSEQGFDTHVADLVDTFNRIVNDGQTPTESIALRIEFLKQH